MILGCAFHHKWQYNIEMAWRHVHPFLGTFASGIPGTSAAPHNQGPKSSGVDTKWAIQQRIPSNAYNDQCILGIPTQLSHIFDIMNVIHISVPWK
jgi:hypothetical protein